VAHLILPSRFNRQPQETVSFKDEFLGGLAYIGGRSIRDNSLLQKGFAEPTFPTIRNGERTYNVARAGIVDLDTNVKISPTFTLVYSLETASKGTSTYNYSLFFSSTATNYFTPWQSSYGGRALLYDGGVFDSSFSLTTGGRDVIVIIATATDYIWYINGVRTASGTGRAALSGNWFLRNIEGNNGEQVYSPLCAVLPVAISEADAADISRRPDNVWQLFKKRPQILYFDVGGGGATTLTADTGTFTLTGQAANLTAARKITADAGTFALTGQATNLLASRKLTSEAGTFALTGNAANLSKTTVGAFTLTADTGTFTLTGQAAGLTAQRKVTADAGSFDLTGSAVILTFTPVSAIGVPANLTGTPDTDSIVWEWDAVSGATGYEIEYGPDGGGYTVTDVGANLTYTQTSLSAATLYEARVRAYVDTVSDRIILESGDGYLLESGDSLLQEAA
jgi:hypothetical protein